MRPPENRRLSRVDKRKRSRSSQDVFYTKKTLDENRLSAEPDWLKPATANSGEIYGVIFQAMRASGARWLTKRFAAGRHDWPR
jgi:hypothetical protein